MENEKISLTCNDTIPRNVFVNEKVEQKGSKKLSSISTGQIKTGAGR